MSRYQVTVVVSDEHADAFGARTLAQRLYSAAFVQAGVRVESCVLAELSDGEGVRVIATLVEDDVLPVLGKKRGRR